MASRLRIGAIALACVALLVSALVAVLQSSAKEIEGIQDEVVQANGIPPMDAAVPARTETATFALG